MDRNSIRLDPPLVPAGREDAERIGDITADAFRADPFNRWLFGNFAGIETLFHMQAKRIYTPRGFCYSLGDAGACMWMLPGGNSEFGWADYFAFALPILLRSGPRAIARAIKTGEAMNTRHPDFTHAYLFSIAVRPSAQGKGLGRQLIQPVLDACDEAGIPAYLENSNPANHGFYSACGFEKIGEPILVEPGAPPLVPMLRAPKNAA